MNSRMPSIVKAIQLALQLDLFSDFLHTERRKSTPTTPDHTSPPSIKKNDQVPPIAPPITQQAPSNDDNTKANKRRIVINGTFLDYELQRSKRRSIGFLINEHGLRITAPRWVTIAAIEAAIGEKQNWVLRKLSERQERQLHKPAAVMTWGDGTTIPYLGKQIVLRITPALVNTSRIRYDQDANELQLHLSQHVDEKRLKELILGWLQQQAKREFNQRLPGFAEKLNVRYHSMSLSTATTRWGSCTSQGKIRLNWRLIHFSPMIIDYVIAHELAHLREMNHSPRFWATVESVFPDVDIARRQLRQHATSDLPNFK